MKYLDKTMKPRHKELNRSLVELGHSRHEEKKGNTASRARQKRDWKKEVFFQEEEYE